jgi:TonB family protein
VAIHAAAVLLVLALTFSNGIIEPRPPARAMILLSPPPVIHLARHLAQRPNRILPRMFRAPVIRDVAAPRRGPALLPALQIPLPEVSRPLLPTGAVAHLAVAPAPPLRTDNLVSLTARAPAANNRVTAALRSSGFEQMEVETAPHRRATRLSAEGFEDATMVPAGRVPASQPHLPSTAPALPVTRSVEILSKPRAAYTEEARRRRIEGEVLLDVLFAASGQVRVLGTVRGLDHGLDENAIAAAEAIRFRPAERAGIAVDSAAIVHIVFQLAY